VIKTSGLPYTIIRSTQFLEFIRATADSSTDGNRVRISPGLFQPIAADDVAAIFRSSAGTAGILWAGRRRKGLPYRTVSL
jgi:uncharacterized protein YbjT (DUF2867 family)